MQQLKSNNEQYIVGSFLYPYFRHSKPTQVRKAGFKMFLFKYKGDIHEAEEKRDEITSTYETKTSLFIQTLDDRFPNFCKLHLVRLTITLPSKFIM